MEIDQLKLSLLKNRNLPIEEELEGQVDYLITLRICRLSVEHKDNENGTEDIIFKAGILNVEELKKIE